MAPTKNATHANRGIRSRNRQGAIEVCPWGQYPDAVVLWRTANGYLLSTGGYSKNPKPHTMKHFIGPGEAIRYAQVLGFAVTG